MKIKKIDISSILPIVIKIIKDIFELVKSLEKSIVSKPYKLEALVLVKVSKDNLKELSKFILSNNKTPESINKLNPRISNFLVFSIKDINFLIKLVIDEKKVELKENFKI